jgi:hypothetical protein
MRYAVHRTPDRLRRYMTLAWRQLNCALRRLAVAKGRLDPDTADYRARMWAASACPDKELDGVLDELDNRPFLIPSL